MLRSLVINSAGGIVSGPTTIHTPTDTAGDCNLTRLANNDIILSFTEQDGSTYYTPYTMRTTDEGATWAAPIEITHGFGGWGFISAPVIEDPDTGDLFAPLYGAADFVELTSVRLPRSSDGGVTWDSGVLVANGPALGRNFQEPQLLILQDGRWLIQARSDMTSPNEWIVQFYSHTTGSTWLPYELQWVGSGRPSIFQRASDGAMPCAYRTTPADDFRFRTSWNNAGAWTGTDGDVTGGSGLFYAYGQWGETDDPDEIAIVYSLEQAGAADADLWLAVVT